MSAQSASSVLPHAEGTHSPDTRMYDVAPPSTWIATRSLRTSLPALRRRALAPSTRTVSLSTTVSPGNNVPFDGSIASQLFDVLAVGVPGGADDLHVVRLAELAEALVEAVRDPGAPQLVFNSRVVGGAQGDAVVEVHRFFRAASTRERDRTSHATTLRCDVPDNNSVR